MPKIQWDDSFSVGNAEIDQQHQKWIEIFNTMDSVLLHGSQTELKTLAGKVLKEMADYATYHFRFEEEYMQRLHYPEVAAHVRLHKDFDNQIYQYNRKIADGELILNTSLIGIIKEWLLNHILVEDRRYSQFVADNSQPR